MMEWQPIETAPRDIDILVWFDHEADPYQDPSDQNNLTDYAALAEVLAFLDGSGVTVAKWYPQQWEAQDEDGDGFWLPSGWFSRGDFPHYETVCNPTHWMLLTEPPEAQATEGGGVMADAPERIWAWVWDLPYPSGLNMRPEWNSDMYPEDQNVKEYIRADLVDAIIAATFDLAEGKCAETFTMFENANPNRPDVIPYIDDACEVCGDAIRALNTEETRTAILADAMKSSILKGQTDDT